MIITDYYGVVSDELNYRIGLLISHYALNVKELYTVLRIPQPHVSHKLARLRRHDIVSFNRVGKKVFYRFRDPWRSMLLHGDYNWRRLNPEYATLWHDDFERLKKLLGAELEQRVIYPVIAGPPGLKPDGQPPEPARPRAPIPPQTGTARPK
jgi:DNA-binding transcriptional ArsR family regulator